MDVRLMVNPQRGATYSEISRLARCAENAGFSAFFRSDHYVATTGTQPPGPTDAWMTIAGLALETSRIRLGTLMTAATFRSPGVLAVQVAQADEMSGGRVELGLGAGWHELEHRAYGIPFPPPTDRFDALEEQLQILKGMWSTPQGGSFSFTGRHFELRDCPGLPKPQQERLPLVIGGTGAKRTPRLAARYADEFNAPRGSLADVVRQFERVSEQCEVIGRDPEELVRSTMVTMLLGRSPSEVACRATATGRSVDELGDGNVVGSAEQAVDAIGQLQGAGVQRLYAHIFDLRDLQLVELMGAEVLPKVCA